MAFGPVTTSISTLCRPCRPLLSPREKRGKEHITKKTISHISTAPLRAYRLKMNILDDIERWRWSATPSWEASAPSFRLASPRKNARDFFLCWQQIILLATNPGFTRLQGCWCVCHLNVPEKFRPFFFCWLCVALLVHVAYRC